MRLRTNLWGLAWVGAGIIVAAGWLPGSEVWALGPRMGMATVMIVLGVTILCVANAAWFLRKTTKAEDYEGGCPVGERCSCGAFNLKPRAECKDCGTATSWTLAATKQHGDAKAGDAQRQE